MIPTGGARRLALAVLLLAPVLLPRQGRASEPTPRLSRLGSEHGLSHNTVFALLQDRQGFLWIGTVDGLDRWDGYEVVRHAHDPGDPASLCHQIVRSLLEDRAGVLWVGTDGGLCRLDRRSGRFAPEPLAPAATPTVWSLFEDREGTLWASTSAGLFRRSPREEAFRRHELSSDGAPEGEHFGAVREDPSGRLWVLSGTSEGLRARLHPLRRSGPPLPPYRLEPSWGVVYDLRFDRDGALWLDWSGPAILDGERRLVRRDPAAPPRGPPVVGTHLDPTGALWFGTEGDGTWRRRPGAAEAEHVLLDEDGGWLGNTVRAFASDRSGAVWLGSYSGVHRWDPRRKPFRCLRRERGDPRTLPGNAVSALWEAADRTLFLGTFDSGLARIDGATGAVRHYRARPGDRTGLRHDVVWGLRGDRRGVLWVATEDGLCSLDPDGERFTWHELPDVSPRFRRLLALALDGSDTLWVGSPGGVHAVSASGAARRVLGPRGSEPREGWVDSVLAEPGALWIGSGWLGVRLRRLDLATGAVRELPLHGRDQLQPPAEGVWMIHRDSRGRLWAATGAGLYVVGTSGEVAQFRERDGLPGGIVYGVLEDRRGRLWLSTDRGLARYDETQPPGRRFRTFDRADGLCGSEFNRGAALVRRGGEMAFGGVDGLTSFDPEAVVDNPYAPPVAITSIAVEGRDGARAVSPHGLDRLVLPWHEDSLAFTFAALSYTQPEKNRYAYRLEPLDRGWVDSGTRRAVRYGRVPPGRYLLRVRASNEDGVWNLRGASLAVVVTPPFWRTAWFRALVAATALATVYAAHRYRLARLLELDRLRLRIAADLHDDLSSDLSGIALATGVARRSPGLDGRERARLAEVEETAAGMLEALRDVVWYVDPEHDTLEALARRLRATAATLLAGLDWSFDVAGSAAPEGMPMISRRGVHLIYKEALHNAVRHSGASRVAVELRREGSGLVLTVRDDGRGFDPATAKAGLGLASMRRRAAALGAGLEVSSAPGAGTTVRLSLDLRRAR